MTMVVAKMAMIRMCMSLCIIKGQGGHDHEGTRRHMIRRVIVSTGRLLSSDIPVISFDQGDHFDKSR